MSVSRDSGMDIETFQDNWYDDLHEWHLDIEGYVNSGNLDGSTDQGFQFTEKVEPLNGIARNEVAEVVAVRVMEHDAHCKSKSGAGTTPGDFWHLVEVNKIRSGTEKLVDKAEDKVNVTVEAFTPGPIFYRGRAQALQPFNDTTNGTGGQGSPSMGTQGELMPYRRLFGVGPLLDSDDLINMNQTFHVNQIQNETVSADCQLTFYFDVHELTDMKDSLRQQ